KYICLLISPVVDCDRGGFLNRNGTLFPEHDRILLHSFFRCLATALQYLHNNKVRHKDIKPGNILVKGHTILMTDFGTARDFNDKTRDTTVGKPAPYTPTYATPEVVDYAPRRLSSDVWSLGCVFLDMITILKGDMDENRKSFFSNKSTSGTNP
ncbi:kinase-like protein, partial [Mytilinidion resinicola]